MGYAGVHLSGVDRYEDHRALLELAAELERKLPGLDAWRDAWKEAHTRRDRMPRAFASTNSSIGFVVPSRLQWGATAPGTPSAPDTPRLPMTTSRSPILERPPLRQPSPEGGGEKRGRRDRPIRHVRTDQLNRAGGGTARSPCPRAITGRRSACERTSSSGWHGRGSGASPFTRRRASRRAHAGRGPPAAPGEMRAPHRGSRCGLLPRSRGRSRHRARR